VLEHAQMQLKKIVQQAVTTGFHKKVPAAIQIWK